MPRRLALRLTVLTGMTGLVYEITWQKYLATLLGSHSEATAAVLGIFLAGMSVGYALFGRLSRRLVDRGPAERARARVLRAYGLVEGGIGVYAFAFPFYFDLVQSLAKGLPPGATGLGFALDLLVAAALIGPPAVGMGGTVPMLTQALSRDLDDSTRLHARVYAFNTLGATVGALAAGFVLVPALGLARLMFAMGALNLLAGAYFVHLARRASGAGLAQPAGAPERRRHPEAAACCVVALLVGFAMMAVQTTLNRLGAVSFGSSEFTFATVVAVFVLCIALGSLAVSRLRRVPRTALLWNQWLLFASLAALYPVLDQSPYWVHVLRTLFGTSHAAFYGYYLGGFGLVLLVVGLPIVFSGATLPLLFHRLREQADDLGAVAGRIYAWNTFGSLAGALLGGYALLFWLDLHHVYRIALAALALAALLVSALTGAIPRRLTAALALVALAGLALLPVWSPRLLTSGFFRLREAQEWTWEGPAAAEMAARRHTGDLLFYDDDPTLSAAVIEIPPGDDRSILNNGKSDSSTGQDYPTTGLLALVPVLLNERPQRAFVIGFGTGVTAGELAQVGSVERVRVAEISQGVIAAAPLFDFANFAVTQDPKVEIVRSDAYRALSRSDERYDLIVSEPSNPWTAGVEMLFSREFLETAREHLADDGVFVQWMHTYEMDNETLALVLRTYAAVFERTAIWFGLGADLLIVGFGDAHPGYTLDEVKRRAAEPAMREALARCGIESLEELLVHELVPQGILGELQLPGPLHTLHHPRLSHLAGRAYFSGGGRPLPFFGYGRVARLAEERSLFRQHLRELGRPLTDGERERVTSEACELGHLLCTALLASWQRENPDAPGIGRLLSSVKRPKGFGAATIREHYLEVAQLLEGRPPDRYADPGELTNHYLTYYHPHVPFDRMALLRAWLQCGPPDYSREDCERGLALARSLLEEGRMALP